MAKPRPEKPIKTSPQQRPESESADTEADLGAFGEQLRRLYDDTVQEPIPDEMKDLLDQLEREEDEGDGKRH